MKELSDIEKEFNREKIGLLKNLEKIESVKRAQLAKVTAEISKFRRKEALLRNAEARTSAHLRQLNSSLAAMSARDTYDRKRIKSIIKEMKRLKKEVPHLELGIRHIEPRRNVAARHNALLMRKLDAFTKKLHAVDSRRSAMQADLDALLKKESMLRQGRIYWVAEHKKHHSKAKHAKLEARKTVQEKVQKKPGLFERLIIGKK